MKSVTSGYDYAARFAGSFNILAIRFPTAGAVGYGSTVGFANWSTAFR